MAQPTTTDSEQYISNKSFDPTFNVEIVELLGYDSTNGVLRPLAVDSNGFLKVA